LRRQPWWARRRRWWRTQRRSWWRAGDGRVTAFVIVVAVAILALAGLCLDGGLALAAKITANGQAEAAARAGAQAIDLTVYRATDRLQLVPDQAVLNAEGYLASVGASGTVSVSGDTVTVTITATQDTQLLGLVGISSLTVHATGSAHLQPDVATDP
jgi:hypothetical protein